MNGIIFHIYPIQHPFIAIYHIKDMNKNIVLIGIIIGVTTAMLVPTLPQETKASTCTSSASAGGVPNSRIYSSFSATQAQRVAPRDSGCSSNSVAVGGQGVSCSAANNGQAGGQQPFLRAVGSSSCSASNHAPVAKPTN